MGSIFYLILLPAKFSLYPGFPLQVFLGYLGIHLYPRGHLGCHVLCVDLKYYSRLLCGSLLGIASFSKSPENT